MKFGSREICDVTFKTTADGQKVGNKQFAKAGMPAFFIDTATTSSLEQATTTVYAQGGRGNNRLIAWEGEKTMTFTIEDALISPMGLAVLSGAGLTTAGENGLKHLHVTLDKTVIEDKVDVDGTETSIGKVDVSLADLMEELGLSDSEKGSVIGVCQTNDTKAYATVVDGSGAGISFIETVTVTGTASTDGNSILVNDTTAATFVLPEETVNKTVKLDFYVIMNNSVTEITIAPEDFGGFFYIEAQTLFRREDTGKDMAAEIIIPKAKVQSGFTFTMAASGDPSTFTFTIDAFPGYTKFDRTKKVMCAIQMVGTDATSSETLTGHTHTP